MRVQVIRSQLYCIEWGVGELQENFEKDARFYKATRNYRKL